MTTLTIRLPAHRHERLKTLAAQRDVSLDRLFEEFSIKALAEFDSENRFLLRAARGNRRRGLTILESLDRKHPKRRS